ncbi:hypothetical protein L2V44_14220, partial [Staphylococcus aureus]|nr:hypothetical protein [Staphylococcus aureus]
MAGNLSLRSILTENKLTGTNYVDWLRSLRIVLKQEKIKYVLEKDVPATPREGTDAYQSFNFDGQKKHQEDAIQAACVMLASMCPELQKQHENMGPR